MTLILIIIAAVSALLATLWQFNENEKVSKENKELQMELLRFTHGGDEVPRVTASVIDNDKVLIMLGNPDDKYPMLNVKVKRREDLLPDIGTLYPSVNVQITNLIIPPSEMSELFYFTIWYNNTHVVVVNLDLSRDTTGTIRPKITYLDSEDKEFTPTWKVNPNPIKTFNPRIHSHI